MDDVIEVSGSRKTYGDLMDVDDVSLEVRPGEIFGSLGLLGPTGAGKTVTMKSIWACGGPMPAPFGCSASIPTATVAAFANGSVCNSGKQRSERLKVCEALELFASLYDGPGDWRRLVEQWHPTEKGSASFASGSEGSANAEVVIRDELTGGLDPRPAEPPGNWSVPCAMRAPRSCWLPTSWTKCGLPGRRRRNLHPPAPLEMVPPPRRGGRMA